MPPLDVLDSRMAADEQVRHPSDAVPGPVDARLARGAPDPAGAIWQDGAFRRDAWVKADATSTLHDDPVIVPKKRWLAERDHLASRNVPLGLLISAGEPVDDIADDLSRFAIIALDFPKFSDGRAFSTARLLREKHGYAGELRAVGNVLADQIPFMRRVGFDTFEVTNAPTRRALIEGRIAEVTLHYQPAGTAESPAGTRPWLRRTP
jgi:phosphoadenosine phosphosulfate reductase